VFEESDSFELEFAESIGGTRQGPLAELWSVAFERVRLVRNVPIVPRTEELSWAVLRGDHGCPRRLRVMG
jgi:hypothetical protein